MCGASAEAPLPSVTRREVRTLDLTEQLQGCAQPRIVDGRAYADPDGAMLTIDCGDHAEVAFFSLDRCALDGHWEIESEGRPVATMMGLRQAFLSHLMEGRPPRAVAQSLSEGPTVGVGCSQLGPAGYFGTALTAFEGGAAALLAHTDSPEDTRLWVAAAGNCRGPLPLRQLEHDALGTVRGVEGRHVVAEWGEGLAFATYDLQGIAEPCALPDCERLLGLRERRKHVAGVWTLQTGPALAVSCLDAQGEAHVHGVDAEGCHVETLEVDATRPSALAWDPSGGALLVWDSGRLLRIREGGTSVWAAPAGSDVKALLALDEQAWLGLGAGASITVVDTLGRCSGEVWPGAGR